MPTPKIIARNRIPYGGLWSYRDPFTGTVLSAVTWENLIRIATEHRRANGNPIGAGFEQEVESQLCLNHPDECDGVDELQLKKHELTLSDILHGTRVMISQGLSGNQLVPVEEAMRRGAICKACPLNSSFIKPCSGICPELKELVRRITDAYGTEYDRYMHSCRICHCFLEAAIKLPLEVQCVGVTDEMKRQFAIAKDRYGCWKQCQ